MHVSKGDFKIILVIFTPFLKQGTSRFQQYHDHKLVLKNDGKITCIYNFYAN